MPTACTACDGTGYVYADRCLCGHPYQSGAPYCSGCGRRQDRERCEACREEEADRWNP